MSNVVYNSRTSPVSVGQFHTWLLFSAADELRITFNVYVIDIETTGVNPDDAPEAALQCCAKWAPLSHWLEQRNDRKSVSTSCWVVGNL